MPTAILLGTAQDAGVPQAGCYCPTCRKARSDPARRQFATCLGLVDTCTRQSWLIDATPDFREQLHLLRQFAPDCPLSGILLTHAHIGHYTGLIQLGREVMNARKMPVYATVLMGKFLRQNAPWSQLIAHGHIDLCLITPETEIRLTSDLSVQPVLVPHRDELSDTLAFVVRGPRRRLFYCPDIDSWAQWSYYLPNFLADIDIALLDGTFFSGNELPGRNIAEIPHPLVTETAAMLTGTACDVQFIHLNHSNPLLKPGPEQIWLAAQELGVGTMGSLWNLE
jgi:pyrroloquinoline quinone biosynthesis protein B